MRILIIGGTVFLGRAIVAAAGKHELTLFNRGKSRPDPTGNIEIIHGDRDTQLNLLGSRQWDTVIDTCGYVPRVVRKSAEMFAGTHYTFVSTCSVYADTSQPLEENSPIALTGDEYGPLKAMCEQVVPGGLIIRPGLIVGPHDPSDRFTYWPVRVAAGGEVLAPGEPERRVQFIDVRDLAEWIVRLVEQRVTGIFNAVCDPLPMESLLATCGDAQLTWVSDEFLLANNVGEWMELPLWIADKPESAGFFATSNRKAVAAGLTFRPVEDTVRATLEWARTRPADYAWRAGLKRKREVELLQTWKEASHAKVCDRTRIARCRQAVGGTIARHLAEIVRRVKRTRPANPVGAQLRDRR